MNHITDWLRRAEEEKLMALTDEDKTWIMEQLRGVETTLLTEFQKWASPTEMRQRSHRAAIAALETDVENLNDRVKDLESFRKGEAL